MKIRKFVTLEEEIEVEITHDDIAQALLEDCSHSSMIYSLNNIAKFLNGITPEMVSNLTDKQNELIGTFLIENAVKFKKFRYVADNGEMK